MKTVCFFSGDITRNGGTERVATIIANGLAKTYNIIFISLTEQNPMFFPLDKNISHYAINKKWINPGVGYLRVIPKLTRLLKQNNVDVVIDIDIVLDCLSIPAVKGTKIKVISWEHFNYDYEITVLYRRLILKYSVKRSDYVVTLTERDKESYGKYLKRKDRISAIYNPIEPVCEEENTQKENWIITTCSLVKYKGIDFLVKTAEIVLSKHKDWKWLVLGDGDMKNYLKERIKKNQLEGRLILTGRVNNVNEYLKKAQIFVLTSRREGLPMCLLEARANSLPSISFDIITGPSVIIDDGVNGFLIKPFDCNEMGNKISLLIEDRELRESFSKKTKLGIEKFDIEYILDRWKQIIDGLCE